MTPQWNNVPKSQDFADLDGYGDQFCPEHQVKSSVKDLPIGTYDCEITHAVLERTRNENKPIVRIVLTVTGAGELEWSFILNKQFWVNELCAELVVLGFDAHKWGPKNNRPLSVEIPKALARCAGIRFRARRKDGEPTAASPGVAAQDGFRSFNALCRIGGQPMPSVTPPPQPAAERLPPSQPLPAAVGAHDDDLPF
jgi:hypothetical protein